MFTVLVRRLVFVVCLGMISQSAVARQIVAPPACESPLICPIGSDTCYLTGDVPAGVYTVTNKDVLIYDATIVPCGTNRTLTIRVYNGRITVGQVPFGFGINGYGIDGVNGADGQDACVPPTAGTVPGQAFALVMETWPGAGTRSTDIGIVQAIDLSGGNGGSGGNGHSEYVYPYTCNICQAQNGAISRPGSNGGSVTIRGSGAIGISSPIDVSGGNGGRGGNGGAGSIFSPGAPTAGSPGGNGGVISISHTASAPAEAWCSIGGFQYDTYCFTGGLSTNGGAGGDGGYGASGNGASSGAAAGGGGHAGALTLSVRNFGVAGAGTVECPTTGWATARGGNGGAGGFGANGFSGRVILEDPFGGPDCYNFCLSIVPGSLGGIGGHGGNGAALTITASTHLTVTSFGFVSSQGGDGGRAGRAGDGSVDSCFSGIGCPAVTSGGLSTTSAAGGNAGVLRLSAGATLTNSGSVSSQGGIGAEGQPGASPGMGCCCALVNEVRDCTGQGYAVAPPVVGANGGAGGLGANLYLVYGVRQGLGVYNFCGGAGGFGGRGGCGYPFGAAGGCTGMYGNGGRLFYNGVMQNILCAIPIGDDEPNCAPDGEECHAVCNDI